MRKRTLGALAAAGVLAVAIGSASTASNTVAASTAGYGTSTITGANATSVKYTLSADGTTITGADLVFTGDLTGKVVKAGFGTDDLTTCTVGAYADPSTSVSCTGFSQLTSGASVFNVAVTAS
jgi:hypothetical protein